MKASLRHGLPYGWWRRISWGDVVGGTLAFLMWVMIGMVVAAWWMNWKPWW